MLALQAVGLADALEKPLGLAPVVEGVCAKGQGKAEIEGIPQRRA